LRIIAFSRWEVQARRQRNYDPLYMDLAVESVVTGKMNPTQAAREFTTNIYI
jgi:hypothetical protein